MSEHTTEQLLEIIKAQNSAHNEEESRKDYKYILYARKSTDTDEKQVKSIADQIKECLEYAEYEGINRNSIKIMKESESAKESGIRPVFREALDLIERGNYDGLIAWHPDRLSRNMREAGEIIDLIDKKIIKDLKFKSFTFTNDTSGKMLLGITFVLSKQYSDKLSDDVSRAIRNRIQEGKYLGQPKHGYIKDKNQYLRPDPESFTLIKKAWEMRERGAKYELITEYLENNEYTKSVVKKQGQERRIIRKRFKMDKQRLSDLFSDSFYTGVLKYGEHYVDLNDIYDFVPMVSVSTFLKVNGWNDIEQAFKSSQNERSEVKADLFRKMVFCGHCNNLMTPNIVSKDNKDNIINYFYYRCDTKSCEMYGKSVRAKVIMEFIYAYLKKNKSFANKKMYNNYLNDFERFVCNEIKETKAQKTALKRKFTNTKNSFSELKDFISKEEDKELKNIFKEDLKVKQKEIDQLEDKIDKCEKNLEKLNKSAMSYQSFLELFGNLASELEKIEDMQDLDNVVRNIFLNFTIKDKKFASHKLQPLFEDYEMSKKDLEILYGGLGRT